MVFWSKFTQENLGKIQTKLKAARGLAKRADMSSVATIDQERTKSSSMSKILSRIFNLPLSVVTTVEASDWSVQLRMDSSGLQSKEPFCRVVMAACAGNVQWNDPEEDEAKITIRLVLLPHVLCVHRSTCRMKWALCSIVNVCTSMHCNLVACQITVARILWFGDTC